MIKLFLRNIKKGFATNSSSYHSTLILTEEEYEKWTKGEIKIDKYGDGDEYDFITYDEWGEDYETEVRKYTTPRGDKIVILCEYGYDG